MDVGEVGDGPVGQLLHPAAEGLPTVDPAGLVGLEVGHRLGVRRPGEDPVGGRGHVVGDPLELLPAPRVRLVEVDPGTQRVARVEHVAVAAHRVALRATRHHLLLEEGRELVEGGVGLRGVALQLGPQRVHVARRRPWSRACRRRRRCDRSSRRPGRRCRGTGVPRRPGRRPPPRAAWRGSRPAPSGTASSRLSTSDQPCSPCRGIMSKTWRRAWSSLKITDIRPRISPASCISTSSPTRSRNASRATASRSSLGVAAVTSASARRVSSSRAAKPSGDRSLSRPSRPLIPTKVAATGSRAQ